jgi:predicted XRE-type DNA-binding protein
MKALDRLEEALDANADRSRRIKRRIAVVRRARAKGAAYSDITLDGAPIVQLVTENATALDEDGVRLRRALAQQLYDEGLTMEQIADVFGVTRQRVSALLKAYSG